MSRNRAQDPRRADARLLDTAEGVIIALRRCSMAKAFIELARTAQRHNLSALSLADALVALAEDGPTGDLDPAAVRVARTTWGSLLDAPSHRRNNHGVPSDSMVRSRLHPNDLIERGEQP
jgi:ANTAR domain-containing protein